MPLSYRDIYDRWERSRAFGDNRTLDQFSTDLDRRAKMGLEPGFHEGDFSAPRSAGWWTKASTAADVNFFEPLARATGLEDIGRSVGELFGSGEEGAKVGLGLPRMAAQTAPLIAAEIFSGGAATPFLLGAGATGALFGAETYANTQDPVQAGISGVTAAALPYIGRYSGNLAAKAFGAPLTEEAQTIAGKYIPRGTAIPQNTEQRIARAVGSQAGMYGTMLGQQYAQTGEVHPLDPALLMQTIPFTALDLYGAIKTPKTTPTKTTFELETEPQYTPPPRSPEHAMAMGEVIDHLGGILSSELSTAEEKQNAFDLLQQVSLDPQSFNPQKLPQQPSLPKQPNAPEQSPFETRDEYLAKLKKAGQTPPETVAEIQERIPNFEQALEKGKFIMTDDGRILETSQYDPKRDVVTHIGDADGNTLWDNTVDPKKVVETSHGDARQKVSAAVESSNTSKQDEAFTEKNAEQRGTGRATLLKNPKTGKTGFPSEAEALLHQEQHKMSEPEAENFTYRVAKRGKEWVVRQTPKQVSYEGKEGTSLENVVPSEPEQNVKPQVDIKDLPQVAYDRYVKGFQKLRSRPTLAQQLFNTDSPQDAVKINQQFEVILWGEKKGKTMEAMNRLLPDDFKFQNEDEYRDVKERGMDALGQLQGLRQFDLGAPRPIDPQWMTKMDEMKWFRPDFTSHEGAVGNILNWFVAHPETPEPVKMLFQAMMKASDPGKVGLMYSPEKGSLYNPITNVVHVGWFPHNEVEAHAWARQFLGHEYFHHVGREVWVRNDPSAVRFKAEATNIMQALRKSPVLPKEVLNALSSPELEKALQDYRVNGDEGEYQKFLDKYLTQDQMKTWQHVVYGLSHPEEMTAMAFSSPKLLEVMEKTQMPKKPTTVLQYFSQVWNKLFGGGQNTDSALAQFLTAYDNYLAGPKVPSLQEFLRPQLSAGKGWLYGLAPYDPSTNVLGGKHPLPKDGVIPVPILKKIGGVGKELNDGEIQFYKLLVPEAFDGGKVNVKTLDEGLKKSGPVVETRLLKTTEYSKARDERMQLQHNIETLGYEPEYNTMHDQIEVFSRNQTTPYGDPMPIIPHEYVDSTMEPNKDYIPLESLPQEHQDVINRWLQLSGEEMYGEGPTRGEARYSSIAPKDFTQMPGYVEGLVRLPIKREGTFQVPKNESIKFHGPHFGSSDQNVLAFYRGYEETLPNGEKAFHVIEVQSDWGQSLRDREKGLPEHMRTSEKPESHPLLDVYNQLALKAAIQHAKEIGATKVILSDAETAMMTEGHDRINRVRITFNSDEDMANFMKSSTRQTRGVQGEPRTLEFVEPITPDQEQIYSRFGKVSMGEPPQAGGMRLNYDQKLPSAMEKLTGQKGEVVDLGLHKSSYRMSREGEEPTTIENRNERIEGSPVFKTPAGQPKTNVTGRMYDLSKVGSEFTLFEPKVPEIARARTYGPQDFIRDSLIPKGTRAEALMSRISSITDFFNKGSLEPLIAGFERESKAGVLPSMFNGGEVNETVGTALVSGTPKDVYESTIGLLHNQVETTADLWWQMKTDLDIANDLHDAIKKGQIRGEIPPGFTDKWREANAKLGKMEQALKKQKVAMDRYLQLDNFNPEGFSRTISSQFEGYEGPQSSDPTPLHQEALDVMGFWKARRTKTAAKELEKSALHRYGEKIFRTFGLTQHVQETMPEARPAMDNIKNNQALAMVRMDETNAAGIFDPELGKPNPKILDDVKALLRKDSPLNRVANNILSYAQVAERQGKQVSVNDPFIKEKLNRLGEPGKTKMLTYLNWRERRRSHFVDNVVAQEFLPTIHQHAIAKTIMGHEVGMRVKVGEQLASDTYLAVKGLETPETVPFATQKLQQLATQMKPETFASAVGVARRLIESSKEHIEFMKSRPWYVSEMRLEGQHGLRMTTPDGKDWFYKFATQDEALKKRDELKQKGYKFVDYTPPSNNIYSRGLNEDMIVRLERVLGETADTLKQSLQDKPEVLQQVLPSVYGIAGELQADRAAFEPVPGAGFPRRKFVPGRELINMVANDYTSMFRYNNWMFHRLLRSRLELDLMDPEIQTRPDLVKYVKTHAENMLKPNNPFARALSEFTYNWQVGANLGTNALEGLQLFNTGLAELIAQTGGFEDAFKLAGRGLKEVWHFNTKRKWSNPDLAWLERWAQARGASGRTSWEGDIFDSDRALMADANLSPWQEIPNTIKWAARSWNGMFYRYNDRLGMVTGFLLGRDRGMSKEQAAEFAWNMKDKWAFTGGKSQRPVGLWSIKTTAVPQLMSTLQTYTLGWFSELAKNYVMGYHGMEHMTPLQRSAAKKAFLYQLGASAVMAGALGLPGVGQGMAVVKQATGVDVMSWLRQHLNEFFSDDADSGNLWTQLALRGAGAAFGPADMSGRSTPDIPFLGVSSYKGFDPAQLLGPGVSTANDLVQGIFGAMSGQPDLKKLSPAAVRGVANLFQGAGDVKDMRGRLIARATPSEKFLMAMGLRPSRIADIRDTNMAAQEAEKRASRQKSKQISAIAETFQKDPTSAKQQLMEYLKDHPEDNGRSIITAIAGRVSDANTPYDWRRHMNVAADVTGLSSREPSSEVARRQMQYSVSQAFGLAPQFNPRADLDAAELDELMNEDPTLTLSVAKRRQSEMRLRRNPFANFLQ